MMATRLQSQPGTAAWAFPTSSLPGIDAPEIRGAISAGEKRAAFVARDALRAAILGELVTLTVYRFDKYGRLLIQWRTIARVT